MRWNVLLGLLALMIAAAAGCQKQCFLPECDYDHYKDIGLTPDKECDPAAAIVPNTSNMGPPPTVTDPDREVRYISQAEAVALALENGVIGNSSLTGTTQDVNSFGFALRDPFGNILDQGIRVLALDPAIVATDIEASLSKFDARWVSSAAWSVTDQPVGGNFLNNFNNGQNASVNTSILKPLPTGGVTGITFRTTYTNLSAPPTGVFNPAYRPFLQFQFDQPLLQGFGVDINQWRSDHPGVTSAIPGINPPAGLLPFFNTRPSGGRVEGIIITRIRFDMQRAEFERVVDIMLANVQIAYWNLFGAYYNLASREDAMKEAWLTWNRVRLRVRGPELPQQLALSRSQYEQYRGLRLEAMSQVLEAERQLRALIGLPVEDCTRLVPVDKPTLAAYKPDWNESLNEALALKPELILARHDIKAKQLEIIGQKNFLLPDLRFTSTYDVNGFGTHLGGGPEDPLNAFGGPGVLPGAPPTLTSGLGGNKFNDWSLGLRMEVPLGYRDAHANVRWARLLLARAYANLQDQEKRAERYLAQNYQQLDASYQQMLTAWVQRDYAQQNMNLRRRRLEAGLETPVEFLLDAQRSVDDANRAYYTAIVNYNNSMARFEYARGTIMQDKNVYIAEGTLPHCAQQRAVEHERKRTRSLVLSERENPSAARLGTCSPDHPELPNLTPDSMPALLRGQDPGPEQMTEPTQNTQQFIQRNFSGGSPVATLLAPTAGGNGITPLVPGSGAVVATSVSPPAQAGSSGIVPAAYRPQPVTGSQEIAGRPGDWQPVASPLGKPVATTPAAPDLFPRLQQPPVDLQTVPQMRRETR